MPEKPDTVRREQVENPMSELFVRLKQRPGLSAMLILATLLANLLGLASSLYVIQVLNRYVSNGVDSTLATLTAGVILAIAFEFAFKSVRLKIAAAIGGAPDHEKGVGAFGILTAAKLRALEKIPPGQRREIMSGLDQIENAYSAPNLTALVDLPFALVYAGAIYLISPPLAIIVLGVIVFVAVAGVLNQKLLQPMTQKVTEKQAAGHGLISTATSNAETVRLFGAGANLIGKWADNLADLQSLRRTVARRQGAIQSLMQSVQGLQGAAVIAIGATLVLAGELDVGMMIGVNLLAARALQPVMRFAQLSEAMTKSRQALEKVEALAGLPMEPGEGSALRNYRGQIELREVTYTPDGAPNALFEDLTLTLEPGAVMAVTGRNGVGKTTLTRLIAGLVEPESGQVLADGIDIRQLVPEWWRRQLVFLPQEPTFLNDTIRANITVMNPDMDDDAIEAALEQSGAAQFVHESPQGLETEITQNGMALSRGIRRRLATARALASPGRLVVFDEPTEGLDEEGVRLMYETLIRLAREGRTIIVSSHDPQIVRGVQYILDMNVSPTPELKAGPNASHDRRAKTRSVRSRAAE